MRLHVRARAAGRVMEFVGNAYVTWCAVSSRLVLLVCGPSVEMIQPFRRPVFRIVLLLRILIHYHKHLHPYQGRSTTRCGGNADGAWVTGGETGRRGAWLMGGETDRRGDGLGEPVGVDDLAPSPRGVGVAANARASWASSMDPYRSMASTSVVATRAFARSLTGDALLRVGTSRSCSGTKELVSSSPGAGVGMLCCRSSLC